MWEAIERGTTLMHYKTSTFIYLEEFNKYMKIDRATLEDIFDYHFYMRARKFLSEKEKKYLHELFEKGDPKHFEDLNDYLKNDGLEGIIGDERMQSLNMDD